MTEPARFVPTAAIRQAVAGRETEVLDALGIRWRDGRPHIRCPYPGHNDRNPSWRWDAEAANARCTCTKGDSIFDVPMRIERIDFDPAKIRVAELIGRNDLVRERSGKTCQAQGMDAASLLNPRRTFAMTRSSSPTSVAASAFPQKKST